MKKRRLFTLALLGAAVIFTSSCADDEDPEPLGPSLSVTETQNASTGGDIETTPNTSLIFAIEARKGENDLDVFSIARNGINTGTFPQSYEGHEFPYSFPNADDNTYVDTIAFTSGSNVGITTYSFTVTDDFGKTQTVSFDVDVVSATTNLTDPMAFTWTRVGGADGIGLDQFGLKWTNNTTTSAVVAIDGETTMVSLASSEWTNIVTEEDLADAIATGAEITQYTGVSATADGTYNDVLGVTHDGKNYLLHITDGTVTTISGGGTSIVIDGDYKSDQ
ncbi:hypothetical protein G3O08_08010 [Cryomorpha ignava]|uniref:Uncharacterized protein n=1 Tax=Cryomorpha ignava TaxID=101383 RepID=A0A7K3WP51_9FLAO|nr:hypothetical protein [Cryomorpha ignava]NEN23443.1 hypothetical protein [Cryomorpha ignava]